MTKRSFPLSSDVKYSRMRCLMVEKRISRLCAAGRNVGAGEGGVVPGWRLKSELGPFAEFIALGYGINSCIPSIRRRSWIAALTKILPISQNFYGREWRKHLIIWHLGLLHIGLKQNSAAARYAPLVLVPIDIIRKSASKGHMLCTCVVMRRSISRCWNYWNRSLIHDLWAESAAYGPCMDLICLKCSQLFGMPWWTTADVGYW